MTSKCNTNACKNCTELGNCPLDHKHCDYCGDPLIDGECEEVSTSDGIVTVCPACYIETIDIEDYIND